MRAVTTTVLGLGAAGLGVLSWASLVERNAFVLRRFEVPVLPEGTEPLRVLHLSDLHLLPRQRARAAWVKSLGSLDADLVINTGDNIAGPDSVPALLASFEWLLPLPGVFVLGSNDYFAPKLKNPLKYLTKDHAKAAGSTPRLPTSDIVDAFTGAGWLDLTNRRGTLEVRGLRLDFVGVDDPHLGYDRLDRVRGAASPDADLTIGVSHAPYQRVLDAYAADGAALIVAGHTHGGQVCVPGHGALITNCDLDTSRVKGLSRWWPGAGHTPSSQAPDDAAWLEVSAGLGTAPTAPVRLACRPEATLLTLVPRSWGEPVRASARASRPDSEMGRRLR